MGKKRTERARELIYWMLTNKSLDNRCVVKRERVEKISLLLFFALPLVHLYLKMLLSLFFISCELEQQSSNSGRERSSLERNKLCVSDGCLEINFQDFFCSLAIALTGQTVTDRFIHERVWDGLSGRRGIEIIRPEGANKGKWALSLRRAFFIRTTHTESWRSLEPRLAQQ